VFENPKAMGVAMIFANIRCGTAAAMLVLALTAGCGGKAQSDSAADASVRHEGDQLRVPEASPLRKALQVAAVAEHDVARPITVPGVVEADPTRLVKIVPPVAGRIVHIAKRLGDTVNAGDALLMLDSADLAQAFADASKADAAERLAQHNVMRQRELMQADIAARKDLEQAESDFAQAQSDARRTRARLAQLGVSAQNRSVREYTLRAPIAGHVVDMTAAEGGFWNDTNAPLMTVADLRNVWVSASVPEKDLASVFVDQDAVIALNAFEGETISGKVRYVGEVLDPDTRTVKARIAVDNANGRFRPGMFAKVLLHGKAHRAVAVPAAALVQSGFDTRVYVEVSPGVYQVRIVKTGPRLDDGSVEVVDGLKSGERIVIKDGVLLND
jgi:cobalt-zinc-cadmium efflux system membrane fusion protein